MRLFGRRSLPIRSKRCFRSGSFDGRIHSLLVGLNRKGFWQWLADWEQELVILGLGREHRPDLSQYLHNWGKRETFSDGSAFQMLPCFNVFCTKLTMPVVSIWTKSCSLPSWVLIWMHLSESKFQIEQSLYPGKKSFTNLTKKQVRFILLLVDADVLTWSLGMKLGDTLHYQDKLGNDVPIILYRVRSPTPFSRAYPDRPIIFSWIMEGDWRIWNLAEGERRWGLFWSRRCWRKPWVNMCASHAHEWTIERVQWSDGHVSQYISDVGWFWTVAWNHELHHRHS